MFLDRWVFWISNEIKQKGWWEEYAEETATKTKSLEITMAGVQI